MRIVWLLALLLASPLGRAVEVSVGTGSFDSTFSLAGLMRVGASLDVQTLSLRQPPTSLGGSPWLIGGRVDVFQSDTIDRITDFASRPLTTAFPGLGVSVDDLIAAYTPVPVPADYRVRGIDLDAALMYRLVERPETKLTVGVNTGLSLPVIRTRNLVRDARLLLDVLDATETEITTYKLGPALSAEWRPLSGVAVRAEWLLNRQWGRIENDYLRGGFEAEGVYHALDLALTVGLEAVAPAVPALRDAYLVVGYRAADWRFARGAVDVRGRTAVLPSELDADFDMAYGYLGLGIAF